MLIRFRNQQLANYLEVFQEKQVIPYDKLQSKEQVSRIELFNEPIDFSQLDYDALMRYHVFPSNIMRFITQWEYENRSMKIGDVIVQQIHFPPMVNAPLKMIMAVRISEIIDDPNRKGFSYETLEGHVEKGISTFTLEQTTTGIHFQISTFSTPGNRLLRWFAPVFTVPYQGFCTGAALRNVKRLVLRIQETSFF